MGSHRRFIYALIAAVMLLVPASAQAAFPGENGKIVFFRGPTGTKQGIWTMNADGTNVTRITTSGDDTFPAWSPDGTKITFASPRDTCGDPCIDQIYTMNADGTNPTRITIDGRNDTSPAWSPDGTKIVFWSGYLATINTDGTNETPLPDTQIQDDFPAWSPDGTKIAFQSFRDGSGEIYVTNADGTNPTDLTNAPGNDGYPSWSPDGKKIAFASDRDGYVAVYTMNADGTNQTRLTNGPTANGGDPAWSPDGTKIAFDSSRDGNGEIYVMNADGTNQTRLTNDPTTSSGEPDWQPIPINSYPRPRGATPTQIALVPAYERCTSPNRTHGSPLSSGSCAPPTQTSSQLTVGTPDANGQGAKLQSKILYGVGGGDVGIIATITDVRKKSDLSDYSGELALAPDLRITDKNNTPNPGGPGAATVQDTTLPVTIPCAATTDTTIGSSCNISTTVNSIYPGAIIAGKRAIWQLGQVQVYDGGSDGLASTTADNTLFLDQGVFVP
jgi:hypothetical protein